MCYWHWTRINRVKMIVLICFYLFQNLWLVRTILWFPIKVLFLYEKNVYDTLIHKWHHGLLAWLCIDRILYVWHHDQIKEKEVFQEFFFWCFVFLKWSFFSLTFTWVKRSFVFFLVALNYFDYFLRVTKQF